MEIKNFNNLPNDISSSIPEGENVLWYGKPDWRILSWYVFGLRYLFIYLFFSILIVFYKPRDYLHITDFFIQWLPYLISIFFVGCLFMVLSYIQSRTTHYVITDKRIIIKTGSALIFFLNAPFKRIMSIDRQQLRFGSGNISFETISKKRIPFFSSWPSVRPWYFTKPQPCFRCINNVKNVEALLSREAKKQIDNNTSSTTLKNEAII
tara:strand:+ start:633 stop:1256 length:624 start_codon:yes stop_codon:yes gene_type:complete